MQTLVSLLFLIYIYIYIYIVPSVVRIPRVKTYVKNKFWRGSNSTSTGWVKVPWKQTALKCCIRINILWNRNDASLWSSVAAINRSPNSEKNFSPFKLIGSRVSMADGTKTCDCAIAEYLLSFLEAAPSVTLPAVVFSEAR